MSAHTYQKVADDEDEAVVQHEKPLPLRPATPIDPGSKSSRWILYLALAVNVLLLIVVTILGVRLRNVLGHPPYCKIYPEAGSRIDEWKPLIQEVLFFPDSRYVNTKMFSSSSAAAETTQHWMNVIGDDSGLVKISPSDRAGLDRPFQIGVMVIPRESSIYSPAFVN